MQDVIGNWIYEIHKILMIDVLPEKAILLRSSKDGTDRACGTDCYTLIRQWQLTDSLISLVL